MIKARKEKEAEIKQKRAEEEKRAREAKAEDERKRLEEVCYLYTRTHLLPFYASIHSLVDTYK